MRMFKFFGFALIASAALVSCVGDDDTELPAYTPILLGQDFESGAVDNQLLEIAGWQNFNQVGTKFWKTQIYSGNAYAEFSPFVANTPIPDQDPSNIALLITPMIDFDNQEGETLNFQVSQSYVTNAANKLEVLVSTDYNGDTANIATATWTALPANIPGTTATYFEFQDSGNIDLSTVTGKGYIAFRYTGSQSDANLDGSYQIDNVKITYQN